jgi:hypothetical protein
LQSAAAEDKQEVNMETDDEPHVNKYERARHAYALDRDTTFWKLGLILIKIWEIINGD